MTNSISDWKISTKKMYGLQEIISPEKSTLTKALYAYRLDLKKSMSQNIVNDKLELSFVLVEGEAKLKIDDKEYSMTKFDSFYIPSKTSVVIKTDSECTFYIGGAIDDGFGKFFFHKFDNNQPIGDTKQVHGQEPYQRDVYMTLGPKVEASRLITGLTWSEEGKWSSWPPHEHEKDLEEGYWYFDMPAPKFGIHLSYEKSGEVTNAHIVRDGDMILAPYGYHPTVAAPSNRNAYFWILAAHSHTSRRYDLANNDSAYL